MLYPCISVSWVDCRGINKGTGRCSRRVSLITAFRSEWISGDLKYQLGFIFRALYRKLPRMPLRILLAHFIDHHSCHSSIHHRGNGMATRGSCLRIMVPARSAKLKFCPSASSTCSKGNKFEVLSFEVY